MSVRVFVVICALAAFPILVACRNSRSLQRNDDPNTSEPNDDLHDHPYKFKETFKEYGEYMGDHLDTTYNAFDMQFREHVTPRLQTYEEDIKHATKWFEEYEHNLEDQVQAYVGPTYSKPASWLIVGLLIVMPITICALFLLDRIAGNISMENMLVFCNGYGALYFLVMIALTAHSGTDPLTVLQKSNSDAYIMFQLAVGAMYMVYVLVHVGMLCSIQLMAVAVVRMISCAFIGLHYYIYVWQPAMMDKEPDLGNAYITYGVYASVYVINCLLPSVPIAGGEELIAMLNENEKGSHGD